MVLIFRALRLLLAVGALMLGLSSLQELKEVNAQGLCPSCGCPGGTLQCCTQLTITCYTAASQ
jgi:hypothetical protein